MSLFWAKAVIFTSTLLVVASGVGLFMGFGLNFLWIFRAFWTALKPVELPGQRKNPHERKPNGK